MAPEARTCFCFPGQLQQMPFRDDQHPLREDPHYIELVEKASRQTSRDLFAPSQPGAEGNGVELQLQVWTYILSMIYFHRLRSTGWSPEIFAEHSMGIYAALAASEAISFEEGLFVTESIGRVLEKEGALHPGAMASLVGLSLEEVQKICQSLDAYQLFIANYNGSLQYVLSGEEEGIEKAISFALSKKAVSATRLAFRTALHSPSLLSVREEILDLLKDIKVQTPNIPILNHWTIKPLRKEDIKDFLSIEIARPVYWVRCVEKLIQDGVTQFIEVGQEAMLAKLIRWINRDVDAFSAAERLLDA
jgi:[acyl-carrier-protein] S-malonyltransferase